MRFQIQIDPLTADVRDELNLPGHFNHLPDLDALLHELYEFVFPIKKLGDSANFLDMAYHVNGVRFSDGPSQIDTHYADLCGEWADLELRRSHVMELGGCPVLEVVYEGQWAQFYDWAIKVPGATIGAKIGPPVAVEEIRKELHRAILALWARMQEIAASG